MHKSDPYRHLQILNTQRKSLLNRKRKVSAAGNPLQLSALTDLGIDLLQSCLQLFELLRRQLVEQLVFVHVPVLVQVLFVGQSHDVHNALANKDSHTMALLFPLGFTAADGEGRATWRQTGTKTYVTKNSPLQSRKPTCTTNLLTLRVNTHGNYLRIK